MTQKSTFVFSYRPMLCRKYKPIKFILFNRLANVSISHEGPPGIPVLKVTKSWFSFAKIPKIFV